MFIPIELQIGEEAIAILPGVQKQFGIDHIKAIKGEVIKIVKLMHSYGTTNQSKNDFSVTIVYDDFQITPLNGSPNISNNSVKKKKIKVVDYRVVKFTFGGVMQPNPKFNISRIEKEENCKLDPSFVHWF